MDEFNYNTIQPELKSIANAIAKAIGPDTRSYLADNNMDTNNAIILLRGDFINTNLRSMVVATSNNLELKHFKRFVWTGVILIDRNHHITITISARPTLNRIKAVKGRKNPHYLQSMCHVLNGDLKAECKQMTFADMEGVYYDPLFADEVYEDDFDSIMGAAISQSEEYRHYVIAYEAERMELKSLSLITLDADLDIVKDISLMDLLQPDFSSLTAEIVTVEETPQKKDSHSLVKVRKDVKSKNSNEPDKKTVLSTKRKEVGRQA